MAEIATLLASPRTISDNCPCITSFAQAGVYNTFGMMTEGDAAALQKEYEALAAQKASLSEYKLLTRAEALLEKVQSAIFTADIIYADATDSTTYTIDTENKLVTLYFNRGADLTAQKLTLSCSPGAVQAVKLPTTVDLSKPIVVPVYCPKNKSYQYWRVTGVYEGSAGLDYTEADNWFSVRPDGVNTARTEDGSLVLKHGTYAVMSRSYNEATNGASVRFIPMSYLPQKAFTLMLGAASYETDNPFKTGQSDRLEIRFENSTASLYSVKDGAAQLIKKANTSLTYNSENQIEFSLQNQGSQTLAVVTLNGEPLFRELISGQTPGGYFGFWSEKNNICIR